MTSPARLAAYDALSAIERRARTLPDALAAATARVADDRDLALAAEVVRGTLRWRAALDHLIAQVSDRPLDRLDAGVLRILRLSAYQLRYLDRVPASAVVHDAVELVRQVGTPSAAGFVNAVLRRLLRDPGSLPVRPNAPDGSTEDALDYLSVTLSHPRWLAARWLARIGFDPTERWCRFDNEHAPLTLRANTLRVSRDQLAERLAACGVTTRPTAFAPDGLVVLDGQPLRTHPGRSGDFLVQDEASQLVATVVDARPGLAVLDACAAPGGKTVALAGAMRGEGLLVAADVRPRRMRLLARTLASAGVASVRLVQAALDRGAPFADRFDRVLLDAPCSGLGTLRRDPDVRWRREEADLAIFAGRQGRLLAAAATAVRAGGRLIYATCSSEPDENEAVVDDFLASRDDFVLLGGPDDPAVPPAVIDRRGFLRTSPPEHGLEAFFAAVLERR